MLKRSMMLAAVTLFAAVGSAFADTSAYFSLPADFAGNVQATIVGIAGGILVILGLMFAWRKTIKSVNRS